MLSSISVAAVFAFLSFLELPHLLHTSRRRKHILVIFQGQLDDPAQRRLPELPPAQIGDGQRIGIARSDLPGHLHLGGLTVPHSRTGRESDGQCSQNDKYRNSFHRFFSFALIR